MPSTLESKADTKAEQARARFDAVHAEDPSGEAPRYHAALARWVRELVDAPSDALILAAHAQHLGRFRTPRATFPEGLAGYKKWRATLARKHAEDAARILEDVGYDEATRDRVVDLVTKKRLGRDPEVDAFEDAICLTFLELELHAFASRTPREKVIDIVQKTWAKMTPRGHARALALLPSLPASDRELLGQALA